MRALSTTIFAMYGALLLSCGPPPPPKDQVQQDIKVINDENSPDKLLARGKAFHSVGDLTRAEQYYAASIKAGASEREVLPLLLRVCVQGNRYRVGIEYAEPVLAKHPDDYRLRMVVASLYTAIGQFETARTQLETVIKAQPNEPTARYSLAVILRDELHDVVGADRHFREYLRIEPAGPHAEEARGSLLKSVPDAGADAGPVKLVPQKSAP